MRGRPQGDQRTYLSGARRWCPPRRWVEIGTFEDGTPTQIPRSQGRILVTGPAGAGKSYLTGLLAEQWIMAGYSVLVIDPEGDHLDLRELNQVQIVDARHYLPEPSEAVTMLGPYTSVAVDLSALAESTKIDYLHRLRPAAEAHREQHGFPHWVIYDEAQLLGTGEEARWVRRGGVRLVIVCAKVTTRQRTRQHRCGAQAHRYRHLNTSHCPAGMARQRGFRIRAHPVIHHRRAPHRPPAPPPQIRDVILPHERRFYFRATDGQYTTPAGSMRDFRTALAHLDRQALQYHLEHGDFSRWLDSTIADRDLADQVAAWEDQLLAHRAADLEHIRHQLIRAVEDRYLDASDIAE